ncbi:hypothetical protein RUESEDTHA_00479 [Ruegeria sp. THAF57]|uniref:hypothetical protein n=1 Tax=Ruegeria sp. THAF57 TaxID=2744555 RepID=UPI0015DDA187|nr:hypothetical protein [Ruegeria sp. THAF57]CAD0183606.1 hypothetical protein RUESEDTHA_00479 [Ruegeria sp. THAF57]
MLGEHQKRLLQDMFENLPGISFLILSRATDDLRLAGWVGTVLATLVCLAYVKRVLRAHPILLGINIFMVVITPLIEILVLSGSRNSADLLIGNIDSLVLGSVFVTGVVLTLFTAKGFLTYDAKSAKQMRIHSTAMLTLCVAGIVWSAAMGQNYLITLAVPLMVLFGCQRFLRAGATDRQSRGGVLLGGTIPIDPPAETVA